MTRAISKPQFILLFIYVIFVAHTLAKHSEVVKNEFMAWRKRSHEARLSARTNGSPQSSNVTGSQKPQEKDLTSKIWAGAVEQNPPSGQYKAVSAIWSIPDVELPPVVIGGARWSAAVWVGIDGVDGPCGESVMQAGTVSFILTDSNGDIFSRGVLVWYEWYPGPAVHLEPAEYPVEIGDPISVYVVATTLSEAIAVFKNPDTAYTLYRPFSPPDGVVSCGHSAEWIVERPQGSQLADYGTMSMQDCQASTTEYDPVDLTGATLMVMIDQNGETIGQPSLETSSELKIVFIYT